MDRNPYVVRYVCGCSVALRKESVDRNIKDVQRSPRRVVALRKESVDRNPSAIKLLAKQEVALRKESVDRNLPNIIVSLYGLSRSPQGERG